MMLLVLRQPMVVVGVGVFLGLAVALVAGVAFGSQLATFLVRVNPTDPRTLAGTAGGLTLVAVLACLVPARRTARIDPLLALRQD